MQTEIQTHAAGQFERNWAMLAHLTALLTIVVGFYSGGTGAVLALLVPLGLYIYFSVRSRYVAYHALQATAFQALGGIVAVVALGAMGVAVAGAWTVTALLSLAVVGLVLVPFALALTGLIGLSAFSLLAGLAAYPLRGAYQAYNGEAFSYPLIGPYVARVIAGGAPPGGAHQV